MKSTHSPYIPVEAPAPAYFAGANTAHGFAGIYDSVANERTLDRVYILKGGAGTGKSTLLRRVAATAESAGLPVTRYLCGSDPASLDCVVLDDRVALLDGTAPHTRDMTFPGAASTLLDLSRFWDSTVLESRRDEILAHGTTKTACWDAAYRYLRAADAVEREKNALAERMLDRDKAEAAVGRLVKKLGKPGDGECGRVTVRYTRAVTMRGRAYLPTFERLAGTVYAVADVMGLAVPVMRMLSEKLTSAGFDTEVSRYPVTGDADGVYIPGKGVAFVIGAADGGKCVNTARFLRRTESPVVGSLSFQTEEMPKTGDRHSRRGQFRLAGKVAEACMAEAEACLARAAEEHFALEEIYKGAMDFAALGRYGKKVEREVMERLM